MKTLVILAIAWVFGSGIVCADSISEANAKKTSEIIEQAVTAHGGKAGLDTLVTLVIEHESSNFAVDQSRGTSPPWDQNDSNGYDAIDVNEHAYVTHNVFNSIGFQGSNRNIVNGEESYQVDLRAGTATRVVEADFATASGPFVRTTPALLVSALRDRSGNAHYLGEVTDDGATYDVVAFSMTVGPAITLYFDQDTHLLHHSERILPGIGLARYEFADYETISGMPFNRVFRFLINGDLNVDRELVATRVNAPLDKLLAVEPDIEMLPETTPDTLARQEIADGVWLIGGSGTYAMFVDMGEYIFAAGGTAGIPERIELLREVAGAKPLRYGMLTHHHSDHVLGVSAYEAEGATIIAAASHEAIARRAAVAGDALDVRTVADRMTLEAGGRVIEILDLGPTAHTEHLLVAYLPAEGILFEADHFSLPRVGPVRPAVESTRTFAAALASHELLTDKLLSAHSPRVASMADLRAALEAETYQARRR